MNYIKTEFFLIIAVFTVMSTPAESSEKGFYIKLGMAVPIRMDLDETTFKTTTNKTTNRKSLNGGIGVIGFSNFSIVGDLITRTYVDNNTSNPTTFKVEDRYLFLIYNVYFDHVYIGFGPGQGETKFNCQTVCDSDHPNPVPANSYAFATHFGVIALRYLEFFIAIHYYASETAKLYNSSSSSYYQYNTGGLVTAAGLNLSF